VNRNVCLPGEYGWRAPRAGAVRARGRARAAPAGGRVLWVSLRSADRRAFCCPPSQLPFRVDEASLPGNDCPRLSRLRGAAPPVLHRGFRVSPMRPLVPGERCGRLTDPGPLLAARPLPGRRSGPASSPSKTRHCSPWGCRCHRLALDGGRASAVPRCQAALLETEGRVIPPGWGRRCT